MSMNNTIIGTGIFNLDRIVVREYPAWPALRPFEDKLVLEEVGGTCGNVMSILAWMGWDARPLVKLDDTPEGHRVADGLEGYGCDCRYVTVAPDGGTTILTCTHKKDREGGHVLSCRAGSPGGSRFPKRRFLRMRDEAPAFLEALKDTPAVFFFDDPAAGNRALARGMKERGALVYFEPSRIGMSADREAVILSDVVKFSDENVPIVKFADLFPDKVFIQTMGAKGVRVKYKTDPWQGFVLSADAPVKVVDTEGAGDWFTATFINELAAQGVENAAGLTRERVMAAVRQAMCMAALSVGYLGSKGMIREG